MTEGNNRGLHPMGGSGLGPDPERSHIGPFTLQSRGSDDSVRTSGLVGRSELSQQPVTDAQIAILVANIRLLGLDGEAM